MGKKGIFERDKNNRKVIARRSYNLYSDIQKGENVVVEIPVQAGEKHFKYEQKVKLVNPKLYGRGYEMCIRDRSNSMAKLTRNWTTSKSICWNNVSSGRDWAYILAGNVITCELGIIKFVDAYGNVLERGLFFPIRNPDGDEHPLEPQTVYVMFSVDRIEGVLLL